MTPFIERRPSGPLPTVAGAVRSMVPRLLPRTAGGFGRRPFPRRFRCQLGPMRPPASSLSPRAPELAAETMSAEA